MVKSTSPDAVRKRRRRNLGGSHREISKLLLNLRNVPDDVRAMLDAKRIAYYETPPSFWGVSSGGIWVTEDADFADAKRALDDYEQQRSARQISGRRRSRNVSRHGCLIP